MQNQTESPPKRSLKQKIVAFVASDGYMAIVESFAGIMLGALLVQIILLALGFYLGTPLFGLQLIGFATVVAVYILFKGGAKASHMMIGRWALQISPLLFVLGVLAPFLKMVASKSQTNGVNVTPFLTMMFIGGAIGYATLMRNQAVKDFLDEWDEKLDLTQLDTDRKKHGPSDMIIGKKYDVTYKDNGEKVYTPTENEVIIPIKDRYLHMLIIGPTGSGKTSQVLIPQINRDIQNRELGLIVLEPKGDLAEQVFAMAEYYGREDAAYFNPTHPDCPYFNPLSGPEDDVIENMTTTFKTLSKGSSTFFEDQGEMLIRRSLSVLKRMEKDPAASGFLYGDEATMLDLSTLIHNNESKGRRMVTAFSKIAVTSEERQKENDDIAAWFLSDYFTGSNASDTRGATKTYEHTSGMRNQVAKLVSNIHLRRVLNPPKGKGNEVDFYGSLERGSVLALTTNQGKLRDLGRFLGYFLVLQMQSAIFKRPGNEDTRRGCMLFIDEFQVYANEGFEDMLTQGRSYRVACHLATQAIEQISAGGQDGKKFLAVVKTNCRNLIAFPDIDPNDAKWFSDNFGERIVTTIRRGESRQKIGFGNMGNFRPTNVSTNRTEQLEPRFTPADIMGRQFGEISYKIMQNNSVAEPGIARVEFISYELKTQLDAIVSEYNEGVEELPMEEAFLEAPAPVQTTGADKPADNVPQPGDPSLKPVPTDDYPTNSKRRGNFDSFMDAGGKDTCEDMKIVERGNYVQDGGIEEEDL